MTSVVRYAIPQAIADIPRDRHAVIEASAGTGKTYLIERRVVDLLLRPPSTASATPAGPDRDPTDLDGYTSLDEILVVTFTEKATAELRTRIRRLLHDVAAARAHTARDDEPHWRIDARARKAIQRALYGFDAAPIYTIHAFCQRVLTENAFANRRLFEQVQVDRRAAFAAAFKTAVRRNLARDPAPRAYLERWLRGERSLDQLEQLLLSCADARGRLAPPFEPAATAAALAALPALTPAELAADATAVRAELRGAGLTASQTDKILATVGALAAAVTTWRVDGDLAGLLAITDDKAVSDGLHDVLERLGPERVAAALGHPTARAVRALGLGAANALVPLSSAIAQTFLPIVLAQLADDKRRRGQFDFDDMLALVWDSLEGSGGVALARSLRERYRHALIDEFQDTDELQWQIFRRVFVEAPGPTLCVIGDPKQAIYGFRGADVHTYLRARDELKAGGGAHVALSDNWRSSEALVSAYNELLRDDVSSPLLTGEIRYTEPVRPRAPGGAATADGAPVAPVCLLELRPREGKLNPAALRGAFARRIAREIHSLLTDERAALWVGEPPARRRVRAGDIFVLTRSGREAVAASDALREAGVASALYKQEGLFQTPEAAELLDLLRAIASPHDHSARLKAWQTRLFGVPLAELMGARDLPETHPLLERLLDWHELATRRAYEDLFEHVVADSGLVRRELFASDGERALTNYLHIIELLLEDARSARLDLGELCRRLDGYIERRRLPAGVDGNVQRLESERNAVQVMTMHKAKGLEAEVVFLYGGFGSGGGGDVRVYHRDRERIVWAGPMWNPEARAQHKLDSDQEEQRLLYVALTRARSRLYLPYVAPEHGTRIGGGYAVLRAQLERVASTRDPRFEVSVTAADAPDDHAPAARPLSEWAPPDELTDDPSEAPAIARLRRERAGPWVTSYTRMKQLEAFSFRGGIDRIGADALTNHDLPGGTATGVFLHDVLEHVPFSSLVGVTDPQTWRARPEIGALLDERGLRHRQDPRHLPRAAAMLHASLTAPVPALGGLPIWQLTAERREVEFLFALRDPSAQRFVKGFIDLVFEHDGALYVLDWKSDALPDYGPATIAAHTADQYALQIGLYSLAAQRMLGGHGRSRYGGMLYCYLRGAAFYHQRPDDDALARFERALAVTP